MANDVLLSNFKSSFRSMANSDEFAGIDANNLGLAANSLISGFKSSFPDISKEDEDAINSISEDMLREYRDKANINNFIPKPEEWETYYAPRPDFSVAKNADEKIKMAKDWEAASLEKAADLVPAYRKDFATHLEYITNNDIRESVFEAKKSKGGLMAWIDDKTNRAVEGALSMVTPFIDGSDRWLAESFPEDPSTNEDFSSLLFAGAGQLVAQAGIALATSAVAGPEAGVAAIGTIYSARALVEGYKEEMRKSGNADKALDVGIAGIPGALLETMADSMLFGMGKSGKVYLDAFRKATTELEKRAVLKAAFPTLGKQALKNGISEATVGSIGADWTTGYGRYLASGDDSYIPSGESLIKGALVEGILGAGYSILNSMASDSSRTEAFAKDLADKNKAKADSIFNALRSGNYQEAVNLATKDYSKPDAAPAAKPAAATATPGVTTPNTPTSASGIVIPQPNASSKIISASVLGSENYNRLVQIRDTLKREAGTDAGNIETLKRVTEALDAIKAGTYQEPESYSLGLDKIGNKDGFTERDSSVSTEENSYDVTLDNGKYIKSDSSTIFISGFEKSTVITKAIASGEVGLVLRDGKVHFVSPVNGVLKGSTGLSYSNKPSRSGQTAVSINKSLVNNNNENESIVTNFSILGKVQESKKSKESQNKPQQIREKFAAKDPADENYSDDFDNSGINEAMSIIDTVNQNESFSDAGFASIEESIDSIIDSLDSYASKNTSEKDAVLDLQNELLNTLEEARSKTKPVEPVRPVRANVNLFQDKIEQAANEQMELGIPVKVSDLAGKTVTFEGNTGVLTIDGPLAYVGDVQVSGSQALISDVQGLSEYAPKNTEYTLGPDDSGRMYKSETVDGKLSRVYQNGEVVPVLANKVTSASQNIAKKKEKIKAAKKERKNKAAPVKKEEPVVEPTNDEEALKTKEFTQDEINSKKKIGEGSESEVYEDGSNVIKVAELYNAKETLAERVVYALRAEKLLGNLSGLRYAGFRRGKNGVLNPVFSQRKIEGESASREQVKALFEKYGWTENPNGSFSIVTTEGKLTTLSDLYDGGNVVNVNGAAVPRDIGTILEPIAKPPTPSNITSEPEAIFESVTDEGVVVETVVVPANEPIVLDDEAKLLKEIERTKKLIADDPQDKEGWSVTLKEQEAQLALLRATGAKDVPTAVQAAKEEKAQDDKEKLPQDIQSQDLPPIPDGYVRLTHSTSSESAEQILKDNKFDYSRVGVVDSSTDSFSSNDQVVERLNSGKSGAFSRGGKGTKVLIMDVPIEEHRKMRSNSADNPGFVSGERIVAVYDAQTKQVSQPQSPSSNNTKEAKPKLGIQKGQVAVVDVEVTNPKKGDENGYHVFSVGGKSYAVKYYSGFGNGGKKGWHLFNPETKETILIGNNKEEARTSLAKLVNDKSPDVGNFIVQDKSNSELLKAVVYTPAKTETVEEKIEKLNQKAKEAANKVISDKVDEYIGGLTSDVAKSKWATNRDSIISFISKTLANPTQNFRGEFASLGTTVLNRIEEDIISKLDAKAKAQIEKDKQATDKITNEFLESERNEKNANEKADRELSQEYNKIKYSIGSEQPGATIDPKEAQDFISQNHPGVEVVNTRKTTDDGHQWRGRTDFTSGTPKITINLANIRDLAQLKNVIHEELAHIAYNDPSISTSLKKIVASTKLRDELSSIYQEGDVFEESVVKRMADLVDSYTEKGTFGKLVTAIKSYIKDKLGMTLSDNDLSYIAYRAIVRASKVTSGQGQTKFQKEQNSLDVEYLSAVESGDITKVQSLVDEAAKSAGYKEVFRAVRGNVDPLKARDGYLTTFTTRKEVADSYGQKNEDTRRYFIDDTVAKEFPSKDGNFSKSGFDGAAANGNDLIVARKVYDIGPFASLERDPDMLFSYSSDIYGTTNAESVIKSAEPVVKDGNGRIIPPSERFNESNKNTKFNKVESSPSSLFEPEDDILSIVTGQISEDKKRTLRNIHRAIRKKLEKDLIIDEPQAWNALKAIKFTFLNNDQLKAFNGLLDEFVRTRSKVRDPGDGVRKSTEQVIAEASDLVKASNQGHFEFLQLQHDFLEGKDFEMDFQGDIDLVNQLAKDNRGTNDSDLPRDKDGESLQNWQLRVLDLQDTAFENKDYVQDLFNDMFPTASNSTSNPIIAEGIGIYVDSVNDVMAGHKEVFKQRINELMSDPTSKSFRDLRKQYYGLMDFIADGYALNIEDFITEETRAILATVTQDSDFLNTTKIPLRKMNAGAASLYANTRALGNKMQELTHNLTSSFRAGILAAERIQSDFIEPTLKRFMDKAVALNGGKSFDGEQLNLAGIYGMARTFKATEGVTKGVLASKASIQRSIKKDINSIQPNRKKTAEIHSKFISDLFVGIDENTPNDQALGIIEKNAEELLPPGIIGYVKDVVELFEVTKPLSKFTTEFALGRPFDEWVNYIPALAINKDGSSVDANILDLNHTSDDVALTDINKDTNMSRSGGSSTKDRTRQLGDSKVYVFNINHIASNRMRLNLIDYLTLPQRRELNNVISGTGTVHKEFANLLKDTNSGSRERVSHMRNTIRTAWSNAVQSASFISEFQAGVNWFSNLWASSKLASMYQLPGQFASNLAPYFIVNAGSPKRIKYLFDAFSILLKKQMGQQLDPRLDKVVTRVLSTIRSRSQDQHLDKSIALDRNSGQIWEQVKSSKMWDSLKDINGLREKIMFAPFKFSDYLSGAPMMLANIMHYEEAAGRATGWDGLTFNDNTFIRSLDETERFIGIGASSRRGVWTNNKNGWLVVVRNMLSSFSSHRINNATNAAIEIAKIRDSNITSSEKGEAFKYLMGIYAQSAMFSVVKWGMVGTFYNLLTSKMGEEENEDELEKAYRKALTGNLDKGQKKMLEAEIAMRQNIRNELARARENNNAKDIVVLRGLQDMVANTFLIPSVSDIPLNIFVHATYDKLEAEHFTNVKNQTISDLEVQLKKAKASKNTNLAIELQKDISRWNAQEAIPLVYERKSIVPTDGLYGGVLNDAYKFLDSAAGAALTTESLTMSDVFAGAGLIGLSQPDLNRWARLYSKIDEYEAEYVEKLKEIQAKRLKKDD